MILWLAAVTVQMDIWEDIVNMSALQAGLGSFAKTIAIVWEIAHVIQLQANVAVKLEIMVQNARKSVS